ncbi:MAG TPA: hypothetical protein VEG84_04975 [Thermoanaerobaculia bacterium]|nr:hypothetical protein [Thermoanaerobaculia bacterium]
MSGSAAFPHAYPFRFVDLVLEERNADFSRGRVKVQVTANARAAMGEQWGSPVLLVEALAQGALLLEGGDAEAGRRGFLAGIEGFEARRAPTAGETLSLDLALSARFGPIVRFDGRITSGDEEVARGGILVRKGEGDTPSSAA